MIAATLTDLTRQTHVWFADPGSIHSAERIQSLLSALSVEERRRHLRLLSAEHQQQFLASHCLLRAVLSRYVPMPSDAWSFRPGPHGKPEIVNAGIPPLRFNLTHTSDLVACVVNLSGDCGVDAEKVSPRHDVRGIAKRMFSAPEQLQQEHLSGREQLEYFYERWTLREAYVKARGIGIHFPTHKLSFSVGSDTDIHISFQPEIDDRAASWQLQLLRPTSDHIVAVVIASHSESRKKIVPRWFDFF